LGFFGEFRESGRDAVHRTYVFRRLTGRMRRMSRMSRMSRIGRIASVIIENRCNAYAKFRRGFCKKHKDITTTLAGQHPLQS
jgi:hypothetical protein